MEDVSNPNVPRGWFADPWHPRRLRYFDGLQWTGAVAPQSFPGFPLGQHSLVLLKTGGQTSGANGCSVLDGEGTPVAVVRSHSRVPWLVGRDHRTLEFEVARPDGMQMFIVTRHGGRRHRIQVDGGDGRTLGQLRQITSGWRQFRTGRITFALEAAEHRLAVADLAIVPSDNRYVDVQESIRDSTGSVIATLRREGRYTGDRKDTFSYRLDCPCQTAEPLSTLLFAALFTYYLYDQLALGGVLGIAQPGSSWERLGYDADVPRHNA